MAGLYYARLLSNAHSSQSTAGSSLSVYLTAALWRRVFNLCTVRNIFEKGDKNGYW